MTTPYFEDEWVTIYHGDALDVLPALGQVDHCITDPPYSPTTHAGARVLTKDGRKGGRAGIGNRIDFEAVEAAQISTAFALANPARWTVATVDWRHAHVLEDCPPDGLRFVRLGVWIKPDGAPQFTGDRPATGWEAVVILHAEGGRMRWNGGGGRAVWTHNIVRGGHPTEKPIALLRDFIAMFTDPGDTILDMYSGAGTTGRASKDLGRKAILIEMEEKWCEVAAKRMSQAALPLEMNA